MKCNWVEMPFNTPTKQDVRVSVSGWLIPVNSPLKTRHFYIFDLNTAEDESLTKEERHDAMRTVKQEVTKQQLNDEDFIKKDTLKYIEIMSEQADYYEKHGKWNDKYDRNGNHKTKENS